MHWNTYEMEWKVRAYFRFRVTVLPIAVSELRRGGSPSLCLLNGYGYETLTMNVCASALRVLNGIYKQFSGSGYV